MGKTAFNPVTTKWQGQVGGFVYRIRNGKQIIAQAVSHIQDRKSPAQVLHRMRFKLASQFSKLWDDILKANLAQIERNASKAQGVIRSVAFESTAGENDTATLMLDTFENNFNAETQQVEDPDLILLFNASTQSLVAPDGDIVAYQVVAFDKNSTPIGFNVVTYESDGSAKVVDLPTVKGDAVRYDILAFNTTITDSSTWNGPIGNINGKNPYTIDAKVYSVLISELSSENRAIHGIVTGSYLVV